MKTGKVWTPDGIKTGIPNGVAQKGESLWNPSTNSVQYIDQGKEGVDNQPVNVQDETFIPSNKYGFDKIIEPHAKHISKIQDKQRKFADGKMPKMSSLYKQTQELQDREVSKYIDANIKPVAELQSRLHQQERRVYDSGKIPTFARILPTITGVGAGLAQLAHWGMNPIRKIDTYQPNPYGNRALNILGSMRNNPYPAVKGALDAENRAAYSINQSGGLSGSQRYLGRIAQSIGNMQNIANIYQDSDKQNKAYQTAYANALLQEGNSIAARRQNAAQHDWADFVASHGAKTRGIEQAAANIVGQIGSGFQNEFKYRAYQDTLDLYRQDVKDMKSNKWNKSRAYIRSPYYGDSMYWYG